MKHLVAIALLTALILLGAFKVYEISNRAESYGWAAKELGEVAQKNKVRDDQLDRERKLASRVQKVKTILAGSPMEESAPAFVECGDRYGVNPSLLLAIAQHESSFGRHVGHLLNNAFGWNAHGGRTFDSWADGVCHVAAGLAASYNLNSIPALVSRYAPPVENDTAEYIRHVERFIAQNKI